MLPSGCPPPGTHFSEGRAQLKSEPGVHLCATLPCCYTGRLQGSHTGSCLDLREG